MELQNNFDRCPGCEGRKTVIGMGFIAKTCVECDGVGWVSKIDEPHVEPEFKPKKIRTKSVEKRLAMQNAPLPDAA